MEKEKEEIRRILAQLPESVLSFCCDTLETILLPQLLEHYLKTAEEVRNDKRISKAGRREKLKKLLTAVDLYNKGFSISSGLAENPYTLHIPDYSDGIDKPNITTLYPFVTLDVDLNKDLDVSRLTYNQEKYRVPYVKLDNEGHCVLTSDDAVLCKMGRLSIKEIWHQEVKGKWRKEDGLDKLPIELQYEIQQDQLKDKLQSIRYTILKEGEHSLWDLYEWWLPSLNEQTMKGKDLLDHILFTYTIKRALNSDDKAINKLYTLYEDAAIGIAFKMVKARRVLPIDKEDIKNEARELLSLIISGYRPEILFNTYLNKGRDEFSLIPLWLEKYYVWYYSEYVPERIKTLPEPNNSYNPDDPFGLQAFILPVLLNPYTPLKDRTRWTPKGSKRKYKINNYMFRPTKGKHLTGWLFGSKTLPQKGQTLGYMSGKFPQLFNKFLNSKFDKKKLLIDIPIEGIEDKRQKDPEQSAINNDSLDNVKKELIKRHVYKRNADRSIEIVLKRISGKKISEIATEYGLAKRTVLYILKKAKK